MRITKMYRWAVAIEGTLNFTNFCGYKTKREAEYVADEMTRLTRKKHVVLDMSKNDDNTRGRNC